MPPAVIALPRQAGATRIHTTNAASALRALFAALLAAKPRQAPQLTPRSRAHSVRELHRMAGEYASTMPNLANELRCFASRD